MRIAQGAFGTTSDVPTFTSWRPQKDKRKKGIENLGGKKTRQNNDRKFS